MMISPSPDATASSTTYWIVGLSTSGSISFGWALVAGKNRVPRPAAGNTALRTFGIISPIVIRALHSTLRHRLQYVSLQHRRRKNDFAPYPAGKCDVHPRGCS